MKINKETTDVICDIEYIIGDETYNPNSYNGWTCEEGCSFRYPVNYCRDKVALEKEALSRTKDKICDMDSECINTMKYKFGSNHLYIGNGIVRALEYLEKRYNIDFSALEEQKRFDVKTRLNAGESAHIFSGKWVIGTDIPEGTYIISKDGNKDILRAINIINERGVMYPSFLLDNENEINLHNGQILIVNMNCLIKRK